MTTPVVVSIPHRLGKAEAASRLKAGLGGARSQLAMMMTIEEETWHEDRLTFRISMLGQTASGTIDVAEDHAVLTVILPGLLGRFAAMIKDRVTRQARLLLDKK